MRPLLFVVVVVLVCVVAGCERETAEPPTSPGNRAPYPPGNPRPPNGAVHQPIYSYLSWTGGDADGDRLRYDVFFGKTSPPFLVSSDQRSSSYFPGMLSFGTTYYWKVIAEDEHGARTAGDIWSFETEGLLWIEIRGASSTYDTAVGNYYDPDPWWGSPWMALSSYGTEGAEAIWSFRGMSFPAIETLAVGAYSYDTGSDTIGEWFLVYNHYFEKWDTVGVSDREEGWRGWFTTGDSARLYIRPQDAAVFLQLQSPWIAHSHIKHVYFVEKGFTDTSSCQSRPGTGYIDRGLGGVEPPLAWFKHQWQP
jgi:hypothetical protein